MGNIYNINGEVFRFDLYNLNYFQDCDTEISGHYLFWWHKPTNRYVYCKFGDYCNLVSIRPVKDVIRFPEGKDKELLDELVDDVLRHSYFYDRYQSCNRGDYLLDSLIGQDEYRNGPMKINCVFDNNYPGPDYKCDYESWEETKRKDKEAVEMLGSVFELEFVPGSNWITEKFICKKVL